MSSKLTKNPAFLILWIGQTISAFGNPFTAVATAWVVYAVTGSKLALGGILLANAIPLACMRLFAGALVDRWDRRTIMLFTDTVRAICLGVLATLMASGATHLWYFYVLNVILGLSDAFFQPASFAMLPNLVQKEHLVQANSLFNLTINSAMILGPAVGGLIVSQFHASNAIGIDAVTFALSALSILFLPRVIAQAKGASRNFLRDLGESFLFYGRHPGLLWLLSLASTSNVGMGMVLPVMLPYTIHVLHADAQGFGLIQTAIGIGMLVGSLIAPVFRKRLRRKVMVPAHVFSGFMFVSFMLTHEYWVAFICTIGAGGGVAIWNAYSATFYQEMVPDEIRGRVQSVRLLLAQGTTPVGMAVGPILSNLLSTAGVFAFVGVLIMASGIIAYPRRSMRALDQLDLDRQRPRVPNGAAESV